MFDIGWSEFVVIGVVALIAIGPKELPGVLRAVGQWTTKIRRMASEFQSQFQEALREAEMADLKKEVDGLTDSAKGFTSQFDDPLNLKEGTKWEPKSDETIKPADVPPPESESVTPDGYVASEAVVDVSPVPASHAEEQVIAQHTASSAPEPEPPAAPAIPAVAQPTVSEVSSQDTPHQGTNP
jgi:sec-independent protein translocase protein TatB